jgi:hypothetical protein
VRPSFRIPGTAPNDPVFTDQTWDQLIGRSEPELVPVPWAEDYYWSATFLPIADDDDMDGTEDEDPYDGTVGTGTDDLIMPGTSYRVQVAVWRVVNREADLMMYENLQATWTNDSNQVTITGGDTIGRVRQYDYIRLDDYGVWYRIADVEDPMAESGDAQVTLVTPFRHPDSGGRFSGPVTANTTIASDFKLIGVFEGIIGAPELGGSP